MTQTPKSFELYDIVMFSSTVGPKDKYIGVVVKVSGEAYHVKFYNAANGNFGGALAVTPSEVEWIGHMPEGVEKDIR